MITSEMTIEELAFLFGIGELAFLLGIGISTCALILSYFYNEEIRMIIHKIRLRWKKHGVLPE